MSEQKMCKKCGTRPVYSEALPFCAFCFNHLDLSDPKERYEHRYYGQKLEWEKFPNLWEAEKKRREEYRKTHREQIRANNEKYRQTHKDKFAEYQKKYKQAHREQWNAYQREYKKRKAAEAKALREKVAQLEAQLNAANLATVAQTKPQTQDNKPKTLQEQYFEVGGISYSQAYANMVSGAISSETEKSVDKE